MIDYAEPKNAESSECLECFDEAKVAFTFARREGLAPSPLSTSSLECLWTKEEVCKTHTFVEPMAILRCVEGEHTLCMRMKRGTEGHHASVVISKDSGVTAILGDGRPVTAGPLLNRDPPQVYWLTSSITTNVAGVRTQCVKATHQVISGQNMAGFKDVVEEQEKQNLLRPHGY